MEKLEYVEYVEYAEFVEFVEFTGICGTCLKSMFSKSKGYLGVALSICCAGDSFSS